MQREIIKKEKLLLPECVEEIESDVKRQCVEKISEAGIDPLLISPQACNRCRMCTASSSVQRPILQKTMGKVRQRKLL